jgi:hypothetical protein
MSAIQPEGFKDLSAAFQNCVVSIAVLVGGGWTLYRFIATHEVERAQNEVERAKFASAKETGSLLIKVNPTDVVLDDGKHCIASIVGITNNGMRDVFLDYSEEPFSIAKLDFDVRGNSSLGAELQQESLLSKSRVLRMGESVEYPFFIRVQDAGVYVITFKVPLPKQEMDRHRSAGGPPGKIYWMGTAFINITRK